MHEKLFDKSRLPAKAFSIDYGWSFVTLAIARVARHSILKAALHSCAAKQILGSLERGRYSGLTELWWSIL